MTIEMEEGPQGSGYVNQGPSRQSRDLCRYGDLCSCIFIGYQFIMQPTYARPLYPCFFGEVTEDRAVLVSL